MWARTLWPFSSSTRNMAFGSGSTTVPSSTIASSLGLGRWTSWATVGPERGRATGTRSTAGTIGHRTSRRDRQHLGTTVRDRDGVLEMGREAAVPGLDRPAVVEQHR